jgi:predicted DNA-binding transcriptional regulator AlpA
VSEIPTHPEALLSIDQVASLLSVETRTLRRWRRINKMPAPIAINGQLRWRLATITEWVREMQIAAEVVRRTAAERPRKAEKRTDRSGQE